MKYKAHVPTEQFGFIEVESDNKDEIIGEYLSIKAHFEDRDGLNHIDWARARNEYLGTGEIHMEDFEQMSKAQKYVINEIKKGIKAEIK